MKSFKGNKKDLPSKICATCARPFTWRKKWEKVWDEVKYCSEKCRKTKSHPTRGFAEKAIPKAI